MYSKKDSKKLGLNRTIDLKYIKSREYIDKVDKNTPTKKNISFLIIIVGIVGYMASAIYGWLMLYPQSVNATVRVENMTIQEKIRLERLEVCQKAYKNTDINKKFIYHQLPAVRCATYMGLVYAYESGFGKSHKCINKNNCWGMKGNGVEHPAGFIHFDNVKQGREFFAKKYFQWHYKKKIETFVYDWSMTDRKTYIQFMRKRFFKMYGELEYFYLSGKSK